MRKSRRWLPALAPLLVLMIGNLLWAASQTSSTVITVDQMCCCCAKKIAAILQAEPRVATVSTDIEAKTATIVPAPQQTLSPQALWEAVENAGRQPVKLRGPSGTFTSKPEH